jgi:hypothetical protein
MKRIVLTDEQCRLFDAGGEVSLVDSQGRLIALAAPPFTPDEIAEVERHQMTNSRHYSTQEVLEYIRSQN